MQTLRFLLAVVLMIAVMVITNLLLPAPRRTPPPPPSPADSAAVDSQAAPAQPAPALPQRADSLRAPVDTARSAAVLGDTIAVTSPLYRYAFSTVGGSLVSARMLRYPSLAAERKGQPAELVPTGSHALLDYHLRIGERDVDISGRRSHRSPPAVSRPRNRTAPPPAAGAPGPDSRSVREYTFTPGTTSMSVPGCVYDELLQCSFAQPRSR
jgi:hypothetical protein